MLCLLVDLLSNCIEIHYFVCAYVAGNRVDNATFTRPKKSHDRTGPLVAERGDRDRGDDEQHHQHAATDVEKLARQQEESEYVPENGIVFIFDPYELHGIVFYF